MFHHIESEAEAKPKNQTSLAVTPEFFAKDMAYLQTHGYTPIYPRDLTNFFDNGTPLPKKAVMITLDDGYEDNYINAYPILKQYGFKATIFTPTGLVDNPDYLSWDQIKEMAGSGLVYFANHTWSHHSSAGTLAVQDKEISLADSQLAQNGLNVDKIFAYPYGNPSTDAEKILTKYGYKLAFTTVPGMTMCKGKRFTLPRTRMGNADLNHYGL
jgi:peptidoglycan/xylan/chitin deacetylase (PgdA/CDA1 family)